jgi:hypothetical protein
MMRKDTTFVDSERAQVLMNRIPSMNSLDLSDT